MVLDRSRLRWAESRATDPPGPARLDWVLVAGVVLAASVEALARDDVVWRGVSYAVTVAMAGTLPWRRLRPLLAVVLAFGAVSVVDLVALVRDVEWTGLNTGAFLLVLPYALARWAPWGDVRAGLAMLAVPLLLVAIGDPIGDAVGGLLVLLLSCAIGFAVRYSAALRDEELAGLRSREREELARELHDTVAHHVSAIAVRAQAGRAVAATEPGAAVEALAVIEEEASRALEEMRSMVGTLRDGDRPAFAPQQGARDIPRLAVSDGPGPAVEVELTGDLTDVRQPVDAACYRLAQEAITNALRHARHATRVQVRVEASPDCIRLAVHDDGRAGGGPPGSGFGLVGMAERVKLLGGTFEAGPRADGGWTVAATLPRPPAAR